MDALFILLVMFILIIFMFFIGGFDDYIQRYIKTHRIRKRWKKGDD